MAAISNHVSAFRMPEVESPGARTAYSCHSTCNRLKKTYATQSERQICLIADNIILEADNVYYAWNDATPHKVQRANSADPLEIVDVLEGTQFPDDPNIVGKYCYNEDVVFT